MDIYELIKSISELIPKDYSVVKDIIEILMPYIFLFCALGTCFYGRKMGKWYCSITFFFLGSIIAAKNILPANNYSDYRFWILAGVCITIGILCACFAGPLYKISLVVSTFTVIFASLPAFILFFGETFSKIISGIVAVIFAYLSIKYKYIIIIITTSFSGSFIFWNVMENQFDLTHKKAILHAILMGTIGLAYQCYCAKDMLIDTYKEVIENYKKRKKEKKRF